MPLPFAISLLGVLFLAAPSSTAPLDIRADRLELDHKSNLAQFEGGVEARRGDLVLRCAKLSVHYDNEGGLRSLTADGSVELEADGLAARAGRANWDASTGAVVLTDGPSVRHGPHQLTGRRIRIWPDSGRIVVDDARGHIRLPSLAPTDATPTAHAAP